MKDGKRKVIKVLSNIKLDLMLKPMWMVMVKSPALVTGAAG